MTKFKSRPLFRKTRPKPPAMPKLGPAKPRKPTGETPPLPFTAEAQDEANRHFAKAAIRAMREAHQQKED